MVFWRISFRLDTELWSNDWAAITGDRKSSNTSEWREEKSVSVTINFISFSIITLRSWQWQHMAKLSAYTTVFPLWFQANKYKNYDRTWTQFHLNGRVIFLHEVFWMQYKHKCLFQTGPQKIISFLFHELWELLYLTHLLQRTAWSSAEPSASLGGTAKSTRLKHVLMDGWIRE